MTCQELTNDLLLDYAEWHLPPNERNRVALHLDVCEACRARRDELEGMTGALRRATEAPPAALMAQLDRAVLSSLPKTRPQAPVQAAPARRPRWPLAAGAIAALILVTVVSFVAGERTARGRASEIVRTSPAPETPRVEVPPSTEPKRDFLPPVPKPNPRVPKPAPEQKPAPPASNPEPPVQVAEAPPAPKPDPTPPRLRGDLNGDGVVDIADARILQQMITQDLPLPDYADVNGDGVVDIADVREIIRAEIALR